MARLHRRLEARADCVMLNKGPCVVETVRFLDDILRRMQDHHHKKTAMLRRLEVSQGPWSERRAPVPSAAGGPPARAKRSLHR